MNPTFGRVPECERAAQAVSLRLDDELSELEDAQLRAHLQSCAACAALEREVGALAEALRAAPLVAPSRPLVAPRLRSSRVGSLRPLIAAAATVLVVVGSVGSLMRAGFNANEGGPSISFRSQLEQMQFANLAHQRIEQKTPKIVPLPADIARQQFERRQLEQTAAAIHIAPTYF